MVNSPDRGSNITTDAWAGVDVDSSPASPVSPGRLSARFAAANQAYSDLSEVVPSSTPGESWGTWGVRRAGEVIPGRQRVREVITTIGRRIVHIDPSEAEVTSIFEKADRLKIFGQSSTDYLMGMGAGFATRIATMTAFQTVLGVSGGLAVSGIAGVWAGGLRAVYREASAQAKSRIEAEIDEAEKERLRARLNGRNRAFTRIYDADNSKMVVAGSKGAVAGLIGSTLGAWAGQWLMEKISESGIAQEAMEYVSSKYKDLKEWSSSLHPVDYLSDLSKGIGMPVIPQKVTVPEIPIGEQLAAAIDNIKSFEASDPFYIKNREEFVGFYLQLQSFDTLLSSGLEKVNPGTIDKGVLRNGAIMEVTRFFKGKYDELFQENVLKSGGVIDRSDIISLRDKVAAQLNKLILDNVEFRETVTKAATQGAQRAKESVLAEAEKIAQEARDKAAAAVTDTPTAVPAPPPVVSSEVAPAASPASPKPVAEPSPAAMPASKPPAPAVVSSPAEVAPPPPAPAAPLPAEALPPAPRSPDMPAAANLPAGGDIVINKGDTLWSKTRELMESKLQRDVSDAEVYTGVTKLLSDNGLTFDDARNIQPGTHLKNIEGIKSVVSKMLPEAPTASGLASAPAEYIANTGDTPGKLLDLKWDPVVDSPELGEFIKLNDSELRSAWQDMWNSLSDGDEIKTYMQQFIGDGSFPVKNDTELQNLIKLAKDGDKDAYRRLLWAARFLKKGVSYKLPKMLAEAIK